MSRDMALETSGNASLVAGTDPPPSRNLGISRTREDNLLVWAALPVYRPFENRSNPWVGLGKLAVWVKCETFFTRPLFSPYFLTTQTTQTSQFLKGLRELSPGSSNIVPHSMAHFTRTSNNSGKIRESRSGLFDVSDVVSIRVVLPNDGCVVQCLAMFDALSIDAVQFIDW